MSLREHEATNLNIRCIDFPGEFLGPGINAQAILSHLDYSTPSWEQKQLI